MILTIHEIPLDTKLKKKNHDFKLNPKVRTMQQGSGSREHFQGGQSLNILTSHSPYDGGQGEARAAAGQWAYVWEGKGGRGPTFPLDEDVGKGLAPALGWVGKADNQDEAKEVQSRTEGWDEPLQHTEEGKRCRTVCDPGWDLQRGLLRWPWPWTSTSVDVAPGVTHRRSAVGSLAPSQERADLSQGHHCDLKARLMSGLDHESRSLTVFTLCRLWVLCAPSRYSPAKHQQVSQTQGVPMHAESHTPLLSDTDTAPRRDPHTVKLQKCLILHPLT